MTFNCCSCGFQPNDPDTLRDSLYPMNREKTAWKFSCGVHNGGCGRTVYAESQEKVVEKWNSGRTDEIIR